MTRRRLIRWGLIVIGIGAVTLFTAAYYVGAALVAPVSRKVGPAPHEYEIVETTLESESGSKIATWYMPAEGAHATIVLLHGVRGDRRSMLKRARLFHDAGYAIVMIDFQAHGESPGQNITIGHLERYDARAAVDFSRRMNPDHRIGVVGVSMGGASALLASPLKIDALVLESVYPTISEAVHDRVSAQVGPLSYVLTPLLLCQSEPRLGITPDDLRPIEHIDDVECPVLVASGELDRHTTLVETQRMYDAACEPKQMVIFSGAAHIDLLDHDGERYVDQILSFLKAHLIAAKH